MDVSQAIVARSDQMNAIDLVGGDLTVTILDVKKGPDDQPVHIITDVYGPKRPFKPSKTVLRDIVIAWGLESQAWVGKRMTLFNDPTVTWAGAEVGGIRVKALSDIPKAFPSVHVLTRGKSKKVMIQPLPDAATAPTTPASPTLPAEAVADWVTSFNDAADITALAGLWKEAVAQNVATHPEILAAKDARKAELT